jgi:predicted HD superfamily hydrolase involved in NAD metabolism
MHPYLHPLIGGILLTGDLARDVPAFLIHHGCPKTADHCAAVASEAGRIAAIVGLDRAQAVHAGRLHDVSAVFPATERVAVACTLGVPILAEEAAFPMIVHQKLSAVLTTEIFGVRDPAIVSAVGCHTTLKADATVLDKVVFVADKPAWDQPGTAPYHDELARALSRSLDAATLVYLRYIWDRRDTLPVLHPWLAAAYRQLSTVA